MSEVNYQTAHSLSSGYSRGIIKERWPILVKSGDVLAQHVEMAQVRHTINDLTQQKISLCGALVNINGYSMAKITTTLSCAQSY